MRLRRDGETNDRVAKSGPKLNGDGDLRYPHPKVLLIDLPEADVKLLREAGYNTTAGTFGTPIKVTPSDKFAHVGPNGQLPNVAEQEIVVVDLRPPAAQEGELDEPSPGEDSHWQKAASGNVDPGPLLASYASDYMDRILKHGGIFVVFLDPPHAVEYAYGKGGYGGLNVRQEYHRSRWSFLPRVSSVERRIDSGEEIELALENIPELTSQLPESVFTVTVDRHYSIGVDQWHVLARSKYGDTVAAAISPSEDSGEGWVFLFPRVPRKGELIRALLDRVFPALQSKLFPYMDAEVWLERAEYQPPRVLELQTEIRRVEQEGEKRIAELRDQISEERDKLRFLTEILTTTGDDLVAAVIETLRALGFTDVQDADEDLVQLGEAVGDEEARKREDVQIRDRSPLLLTEVKGIVNLPRESGLLQVTKYLAPRMRQLDRTDIRGLSIVNHQRKLPPLDREHQNVFQQDVLTNAEDQGFGLLTTFDLYRLTRGFLGLGWRHEQVAELFYRDGRIDPIPTHYEFLGEIVDYWEQAQALAIELVADLHIGDRIAYELALDFEEEEVDSIQLNDEPVKKGSAGMKVGIKTGLSTEQARKRTRVFRVG